MEQAPRYQSSVSSTDSMLIVPMEAIQDYEYRSSHVGAVFHEVFRNRRRRERYRFIRDCFVNTVGRFMPSALHALSYESPMGYRSSMGLVCETPTIGHGVVVS
jgi:hypothetical protein